MALKLDSGQQRVAASLAFFCLVLLCGSAALTQAEGLAWGEALYFSLVTMSTVGYGDVVPYTTAGRVLASVMILTGAGSFMSVVAATSDHLLSRREQRERMEKLNMVIGVFFSEAGTRLLRMCARMDPDMAQARERLPREGEWLDRRYAERAKAFAAHTFRIRADLEQLAEVKRFLEEKSPLLIRLLENPNLLEHESFTDLLWAVLHIKEELEFRFDLADLTDEHRKHVRGDLERAYRLLARQWLDYMRHLCANYPYLFKVAAHRNPFREAAVAAPMAKAAKETGA